MPKPRSDPNYYALDDLARATATTVEGDGSVRIRQVARLRSAGDGEIAFLANPRYRSLLGPPRASAVILAPAEAASTALPRLVADNPYLAFARIANLLNPPRPVVP